ncbi:DUF3782 domain-containing protein [Candidatus Poribacteria bacterium]|nr:DUF3782 domain-containing protein [Candidatus Poribacteria bacterium]
MWEYLEILENIPKELREPVARLADSLENRLRSEFSVTRLDFERLEQAVTELAQAQKRTEERVEELAQAQKRTEQRVEELAQAQKRTEERLDRLEAAVEELAQAQKRTEERLDRLEAVVEELVQAQKRTEERLNRLEIVVEELAQAQKRTEERIDKFERTFESKIGGLGARWGISTEAAFRNAMRGILKDLGFQVQRYLKFDKDGKVFDQPDQVELDVIIKNGTLILIEITSSVNKGDVTLFQRKIRFYEEQEGKTADRKLIVSPFVDPPAMDKAANLGMEVFTDINSVQ